jgi:hypothetical protein
MRQILTISVMAALALGLAAYASDAGQRKGGTSGGDQAQQIDQQRDEDRLRSRVETQDMVRLRDEEIYGHELMTKEELNQYREKLQTMHTQQEREQFQMQHEEKMRVRAMQQNTEIVPPGQGPIYRGDMMSAQERNEYREQLRRIQTEEERARFLARHREEMDQRAESVEEETEEAE